jgi:hypothetical protein
LLLVVQNSEEVAATLHVRVLELFEDLGFLLMHLLPRVSRWQEVAIDALVLLGFYFDSLMLKQKSYQVCSAIDVAIAELRRCRGECTWRHPIGIDIFRNFEAPEEDWGYVPDLASENSADSSTSIELDCLHRESDLERKSERQLQFYPSLIPLLSNRLENTAPHFPTTVLHEHCNDSVRISDIENTEIVEDLSSVDDELELEGLYSPIISFLFLLLSL